MRRFPMFLMLLVTPLTPAMAQRGAKAASARQEMAAARAALSRGDSVVALDALVAATTAWPAQGAYRVSAARLAAALGRPEVALAQLTALDAMGYAWSVTAPEYAGLAGDVRFRTLADSSRANQAPLIRSRVHRVLPDERLHPEAVAFDPRSGRVFITSVHQRKVIALEPDGRVVDFVTCDKVPLDAVLGVAVDTARDLLWLTSSPTPEASGEPTGSGAAVVAVGLRDGTVRGRWAAPDDGVPHLLGEVTLAPDGTVYATDSRQPVVYRVPERQTPGLLDPTPWRSADWVSLQGLAFSDDGATAWVADWTTGLYRIDVASGTVTPVEASGAMYLLGIDDLLRAPDGRLLGLQNGIAPARVIGLTLDATGSTITRLEVLDRHLPLAEEPTGGVLANGGLLYVANSPWSHYLADGHPDPANPFPKPVLLWLPLR